MTSGSIRLRVRTLALALPLALAACRGAPSGHGGHASPAPSGDARAATPLGTYSWRVTTSVPAAQDRFDRGLRLMYGYAKDDAVREFAAARAADSTCAMCWWGEAWALGSYLNQPMVPADAPRAYVAIQRAQRLAAGVAPVERALIDATVARYAATHPTDGRTRLDSAYADAMAGVHARYPDHPDVAALYADALMLLEPRRGIWPMSKPSIPRIHAVLETVLRRDPAHPGACHAYIHATETTPRVTAAQACADLLSDVIPGVSHINHMPSHTYNRVGRWGDATRSNLVAVATDRRARSGAGYSIYPAHNLHMLLFSATMDGQDSVAIRAAADHAELVGRDGASFRVLVLARFGRWDEVLALRQAPVHPVHDGLWRFARGLAHLRQGRPDSAAAAVARIEELIAVTPATATLRMHQPAQLLGIVAGVLRGEMLRVRGDVAGADRAFRAAAALEAGLTYDEPEPLPFLVHDFLGALLLEAGRPADAEAAFRTALGMRPRNGWSLFGLERAVRAQGRTTDADALQDELARSWARATAALIGARF